MKLIDRYVQEVGKHLPARSRADIQSELRSTLEDMLEDKAQSTGRPADETLTRELLQEYGAPDKVAATYQPPRYLIGPRLYPTFELVLKIVLAVVVGATLLSFGLGMLRGATTGPEFIKALGSFLLNLFGGLISAFGNITLVFAILERVLPASEWEDKERGWNPADLEKTPDASQVKASEMIFTILFTVAGLVVFNLYPDIVGFGFARDGEWIFVPALSQAFFTYLPWINLLGVAQIVFSLWMLRQREWTTVARLGNIVIEAAGILLAGVMIVGPSLVDISAEKLAGTPLAEAAGTLAPLLNAIPALVLTILIIVQTVEVGQTVYQLIKDRTIQAPVAMK